MQQSRAQSIRSSLRRSEVQRPRFTVLCTNSEKKVCFKLEKLVFMTASLQTTLAALSKMEIKEVEINEAQEQKEKIRKKEITRKDEGCFNLLFYHLNC